MEKRIIRYRATYRKYKATFHATPLAPLAGGPPSPATR
jgi:hypothetical protein